jgi:raffinose/stachyose/melibiose transport system permease protein
MAKDRGAESSRAWRSQSSLGKLSIGGPARLISIIIVNLFLFLLFICNIYPLIWQFFTSLRTNPELFANPWGLPSQPTFDNYVKVWKTSPLPTYFFNSFVVSLSSVFLILLFSSMAAYGFAKLSFPGSTPLLLLLLSLYFIPAHIALIPLFVMLKTLKVIDTPFALIIPYTAFAIPFSTILIRSFIVNIPRDLIDAALIDGCSKISIFFLLILPLIRPILAVNFIFQFINCWNEYLFALVFLHSREAKTLPVGLLDLVAEFHTDWVAMAAGLTMATVPVIILYIVFHEQIITGMTAGAIKG